MKLKQIIFALVAILSSFSVSAWAQTTVTTAAELKEALANGGEVTLGTDITVDETQTIPAGVSVTLDLNGKTVSQSKACVASYEMILNKGNLTIKNGTIRFTDTSEGDPTFGWGSYTVRNEGTLVVEDDATIEHLGKQDFATHMICAIFQYSGSTTINGGKISTPKYRSIRLWKGDMTINGGTFDGQFWVQAVDNSAKLTINAGTFEPNGNDASSVFVGNEKYDVEFAVAGGTFNGKIGCSDATKLAGAISGGKFTEKAKNATNSALLASGFIFGEAGTDGYYAVEDAPATHYIATLEDLKALRDAVNSGTNYYAGVNVYLTADIDLAGENWVGIGSATAKHGFMGNFDGNGYKIKNLTITDPALDSDGYAYAGLFAVTEGTDKNNQNTIKNLTIENVTINTTGHIVSAAIAYPYYTIVDNIKVCGDININGGNYTAGVLAYTRRCVNASNLAITGNDGSSVKGSQTVGGVISDIQMNGGLVADYKKFSAEGLAITGAMHVGGISGIISGQTLTGATVKNVNLTCSDARVGLVAGSLGDASAISVVETENVTGATALIGAGYKSAKAVEAKIGDKYFTTLEDALAAEGNEVELLVPYVVAADDEIVLDLKGKTVTGTPSEAKAYSAITNNGNLTIINGTLLCNHTLTGSTGYAVNTITNCGILTIDGATIQNTSTASNQIGYAIDNNSTSTNAIVTINSGNVVASGSNYYDGIRQFCNSLTKDNSVIVKGGEVSSIWMQNPSDGAEKNTKDVKGSISISGGTVKILSLEPSTNFQAAVTGGHVGDISYFQLAEGRNLVKFITGGTFGMDVTKFCADYHNCTSNENGVYEVKPDANYIAEYIIDDAKGENYTSAEKKVVGTLTYKRTLPNVEKWNPLYVPFAIPMSKLIENYDVAYFNDVRGNDANNDNVVDDGTLKMELVMIDNPDVTLNANYPFVFRAKTEEAKNLELVLDNATLYENTENSVVFTSLDIKCEVKGSYSKCKTGDNQYIVNTNGLWSPLNQDYDLKPYRLILTLSSNNNLKPFAARDIRMFLIGEEAEDGTTHIFDVENDAQTQNSIYDLQGRRVLTPQKGGLYIVNGKKTVMR